MVPTRIQNKKDARKIDGADQNSKKASKRWCRPEHQASKQKMVPTRTASKQASKQIASKTASKQESNQACKIASKIASKQASKQARKQDSK
jgi:epidermal growth factor receptor substrate 15